MNASWKLEKDWAQETTIEEVFIYLDKFGPQGFIDEQLACSDRADWPLERRALITAFAAKLKFWLEDLDMAMVYDEFNNGCLAIDFLDWAKKELSKTR